MRQRCHTPRLSTVAVAATAGLVATLLAGISATAASGAPGDRRGPGSGVPGVPPAGDHTHADKDVRSGRLSPSAAQRAAARGLAARGVDVRFGALGTPRDVTATGPLATRLAGGPETVARTYLTRQADLFGLRPADIADLELLTVAPIGPGAAVVLRQRVGGVPVAVDGLVTVGVRDGDVISVSSTLTRDTATPASATLTAEEAVAAARESAGINAADVSDRRVREVVVPTAQGTRAAYQVVLIGADGGEPVARTSYVDARTGRELVVEDLVDHATDNPTWDVFPANPPADYSSTDDRETWCWEDAAGCDLVVGDDASLLPWDVDPVTKESTLTSKGNNALGVENWHSNDPRTVGVRPATPSPDRDYSYGWTNQWFEERCSPDVFATTQQNDIDAAIANLFVQHNRMHDWSYELGFTETAWNLQQDNFGRGEDGNDYEQGNAQAGGVSGGPPTFAARDNANQITPPDGIAATTNMYLWQPIAGGFYAPCVDGDFDMTVIGHEYTHAITNRMVAGPDTGLSGAQGRAMGESWSDQFAMEQLWEAGYRPAGDTPYVIGAYVTGDPATGIRNYDMSRSPLNYSDVGYDLTGPQVHADGEIWSAVGFALRAAFLQRYGAGDVALNRACYRGDVPVAECPGNRNWIQLHFDSLLLEADSAPSMVDMRDNILAADRIRFGGRNQDIIWTAFAAYGLGAGASSAGSNDSDPVPSFASPTTRNATVTFKGVGDALGAPVRLFIGAYEGRAVPVADTDPATSTPATFRITPGTYSAVAQGAGFGHRRLTFTVRAGQVRDLPVNMRRNLASAASGATVTGDGGNLAALVDDTEATNWAALGADPRGRAVTVDLAGDAAQEVRRVQVSAMLRPANAADPYDSGSQSRFTALRSFEVLACDATTGADCADAASYRSVLTAADAFPAGAPRPTAPDLILREFLVDTVATHLRLVVLDSQCTGAPDYQGEQDADLRAATDCDEAAPASVSQAVRAAELQAFAR